MLADIPWAKKREVTDAWYMVVHESYRLDLIRQREEGPPPLSGSAGGELRTS